MDVKSFLPPLILEKDREKPWMEWVTGTVLFSDVSGFTPMSEALSVLGAEGGEILTDVLNRYFAAMIGIVHAHGGQVMKFGGDAILCFFPEAAAGDVTAPFRVRVSAHAESGNDEAQAEACGYTSTKCNPELDSESSLISALRAARLMQDGMGRFQNIKTPVKKFALKMKIGVAHGECLLAGVGDPAVRCDYVFAGAPVDATSDAEHHAVAGEIVFAGNDRKLQNVKCKVEAIEPGFCRILDAPAELETRNSKLETATQAKACGYIPPSAPATGYRLPTAVSSYLIREVHDKVASGHVSQVGALLEIVPVFLKFTGFTYTKNGFDLPLFDAFFRSVMEITERHGGRLNRISMGDKGSTALLLFGTPNPLEKKEQLASQWALDLFAAVRARFPRLTVGAGLNSGRVFTGIVGGSDRWEYTVMGDAVNFAARLMQGADTGQACASEAFIQRAKELYGFDDLGTRKFKGKAEPLAVYALKERRRAGWTAGGPEQSVGREHETQALLERLDKAWNGGPGMAVIEGEAGVGKSFLAARLLQEAHQKGWRTIAAKGEITLRNHAYAPWRQVASDLLFQGGDPSVEALEKFLDEEQRPFLVWFCEFFDLPLPEGTPRPAYDEETRKRLFQHQLSRLLLDVAADSNLRDSFESRVSSLRLGEDDVAAGFSLRGAECDEKQRTLKGAAAEEAEGGRATLIFLDDLHWFDTLSLEFLAALMNHLKDQRMLILAATRPEWEKKDFENRATVTLLSLADLDRDGCRTLAEARLGGKIRDVLTDFLYERTKGNPFFTHQLLDYLLHEDLLETRLGEWLLKRGVEQKGAMTGTEVLLAQVNRLPAIEQAHLQAAACMGPTFDLAVLRSVLGRAFRKKAVGSLMASGYLFDQGERRADLDSHDDVKHRTLKGAATSHLRGELETQDPKLETVSFPHALVQETIYQSLPQRVRKRLHRKIGICMEAINAGNLEPLYPNLANHFHLAGHRAKAVDYCLLAGRQLAEKLSYPEACNFYQLAYGYLKHSSDQRKWETGLALCEIQLKASKISQGVALGAALSKSANAKSLNKIFLKAKLLEYDGRQRIGDYGYVGMAARLLQERHFENMVEKYYLAFLIGIAYWRRGAYESASQALSPIAIDNDAGFDLSLRALLPLAGIEQSRGNYEAALNHLNSGLCLAANKQRSHQVLKLAITRGIVLMKSGCLNEAFDMFSTLPEQAERFGDYYLLATILLNMGDIEWQLSNFIAAERYLDEARSIFSQLGVLSGIAEYHKILGVVRFFQQRYADAYDEYLESIRLNEKTQEMQQACHGYYNLAEVCMKMGRRGEASQWWKKGMASFSAKDNPDLHKMYMELEPQI